ncbi:MAG: TlpA disulfide reductase family protein [Acidimicrobiia bacterium]|nr:TlpA disulfide reductase family protein [Acidimicrobiia bacterium]
MKHATPDRSDTGSRLVPRRLLVVALVVALAGWVGWTALREPGLPDFFASGDPIELPAEGSFTSVSLEEFEGILVGQQGRPVVVNIWASWCAPCRTEMPLLQSAADTYAGQAVILGVASNDDPDEAKAFLGELGLTYPNVFDTTGEIRVSLGLTAYPTTYVFDADGTIRARVNGGISEQRLAGLIEDALG